MQGNFSSHLTTGQFAKLCGTNKRTLFHYDAIGLLSPCGIDQKGYRHYSENQYSLFRIIVVLKEMGLTLSEIKWFIDRRNPEVFSHLLEKQGQKIKKQIADLKRIERMIDTKLDLLHQAEGLLHTQFESPFVEDQPEEYLILSRPLMGAEQSSFFPALYEHLGYCAHHQFGEGHPYGIIISSDMLYENKFNEYSYFFTKISQPTDDLHLHRKPAGRHAVLYLYGSYHETNDAYVRLLRFFHHSGFAMGDFSYQEGIIDETAQRHPQFYVTKISIPILHFEQDPRG